MSSVGSPQAIGKTEALAQISGRAVVYFLLFCISTLIMTTSQHVVIVLTWIFVWVFAWAYSTRTKGSEWLMFWLGVMLFYPIPAAEYGSYSDLLEPSVVLAMILLAFLCARVDVLSMEWHQSRWLFFVSSAWVGWGVIAYLPVFFAWLTMTVLKLPLGSSFDFVLYSSTSVLKTGGPTIGAVLATFVPLAALRKKEDFLAFYKALAAGVIILTSLSFLQLYLDIKFVPSDYPVLPSRLGAFSDPDANGFGRLLLLPLLFLLSYLFKEPKGHGLLPWLAVLMGLAALQLTVSRTSYISFCTGVVVLLMLNLRSVKTFLIILTLLVSAGIMLEGLEVTGTFSDADSDRAHLGNLLGRMVIYDYVLQILSASPWFGALPGGYAEGMRALGYMGPMVSAHSMFLSVAVEWGIPMGVILLGALFGAAYYGLQATYRFRAIALRRDTSEAYALAAGTTALSIAYFVHGLTEIVIPAYVFTTFGLSLAAWSYLLRNEAESKEQPILTPVPVPAG